MPQDDYLPPGSPLKPVDRLGFKILGGLDRIFGAAAGKGEEPFYYNLVGTGRGFQDLAPAIAAPGIATVEITQEADFYCTRIIHVSVTPASGAIIALPSWSVLVTDGSTDRQLMNAPVHASNLGGDGRQSVPWTKNRVFRRNSQITFNFVNLQAVATQIWLTMEGYKVYDANSLNLTVRR